LFIILLLIFASSIQFTTQVNTEKSGFTPSNTSIEATEYVIWTNNDIKTHHIVGDDGSFDSGELNPGQSYSYKFRSLGTFKYHDTVDPSLNGSVRVDYPLMQ
jgi:plastocyanin